MTKRIALIYGTTEGQTKKIADHIAGQLDDRDCHVELYNGKKLAKDFDFSAYDGIIIGASVHVGRYPKRIRNLIDRHRGTLQIVPSAFFSVSMTESDKSDAARREIEALVQGFVDDLDWQPLLVASFAGAVPFSRYGFLRTMIMKAIMKRRLGEVDTSRDYEYTDWVSVDEFVEEFMKRLNYGESIDDPSADRRAP